MNVIAAVLPQFVPIVAGETANPLGFEVSAIAAGLLAKFPAPGQLELSNPKIFTVPLHVH